MNRLCQVLIISLLLVVFGCGSRTQASVKDSGVEVDSIASISSGPLMAGGLIHIDVTKEYPKKEFKLQDIAEVEYISLETKKEFLCEGGIATFNKDIVVLTNFKRDGHIYIFDRTTGKALKHFNRQGKSGEEYSGVSQIALDEKNNELFVNDMWMKKIFVYDLDGNFKRSFWNTKGAQFNRIFNYDDNSLVCYDSGHDNLQRNTQPIVIISKKNGNKIKDVVIPFSKRLEINMRKTIDEQRMIGVSVSTSPIIKHGDGWFFAEFSSDTIYKQLFQGNLVPVIVRTPPVQKMDPPVFLVTDMISNCYYFLRAIKKEYDFETQKGYPETKLVYDQRDGKIYEYKLFNDDYISNEGMSIPERDINENIACERFYADELKEALEKGSLKGRLKEIASKLGEEDNPVLMFIKFK